QHSASGEQCEACGKSQLLRKPIGYSGPNHAPKIVNEVLGSSGRPLDHATRAYMEPRFNRDFSNVGIHTDSRAAESARAVDAVAYTVGRNIVFGREAYRPGTLDGKRLLAHELAHVAQNGNSNHGINTKLVIGRANDASEVEADSISNTIVGRTSDA